MSAHVLLNLLNKLIVCLFVLLHTKYTHILCTTTCDLQENVIRFSGEICKAPSFKPTKMTDYMKFEYLLVRHFVGN